MIFGVLSLIIWALILVVTVKYVFILLNADNKGEGGTLSLMALAQRVMGSNMVFIPILAMIGAALFYGDAMITPAISVLSAVEGLKIITPALEPYILPITLVIIIALVPRAVARHRQCCHPSSVPLRSSGLWPWPLAGLAHIGDNPAVLLSFNPIYAVSFLGSHGIIGLVTLGAVFLAVTGAEALYADLGHFGKRPIQLAWIIVVFPALAAQLSRPGRAAAATVLRPSKIPFFLMMPEWALIPIVVLATAATIIASQAVITGAYSLTRQAIQLGLLPRMEIRFTSEAHAGQIYMPQVNWLIMLGVLILVVLFKTSSQPRLRLWHRGHGHHGGDLHDGDFRHLEILEMAALGCPRHDAAPACRLM